YADWLEEREDPRGEFIRLQIELEPLHLPRADPLAELQRVRTLRGRHPDSGASDGRLPLAKKLHRESELLRQHETAWLGPAVAHRLDWRRRGRGIVSFPCPAPGAS